MAKVRKKPKSLIVQLQEAIKRSELSCYEISKRTGITEAQLSNFMNDKAGISLKTADKIAQLLGLDLL